MWGRAGIRRGDFRWLFTSPGLFTSLGLLASLALLAFLDLLASLGRCGGSGAGHPAQRSLSRSLPQPSPLSQRTPTPASTTEG